MVQPYIDYKTENGYDSRSLSQGTGVDAQNDFRSARYWLKKADEAGDEAKHRYLANANLHVRSMLERVGRSTTGFQLLDWTTKKNRVMTVPVVLDDTIIKQVDPATQAWLLPFLERNYWARKHGEKNPATEVTASTGDYVLSLFAGKNMYYDLSASFDLAQARAWRGQMYVDSARLDALGDEWGVPAVQHHQGAKYVESWEHLKYLFPRRHHEYIDRWSPVDAQTLDESVRDEPRIRDNDPTGVNVNWFNGEWWQIDLGRFNRKVPRSHHATHLEFEPGLPVPDDERLAGQERFGFHGAYGVLTRQIGWRMQEGIIVPFSSWEGLARERFLKYGHSLQVVSALPEIKKTYKLAALALDIDFGKFCMLVSSSELRDEGSWSHR